MGERVITRARRTIFTLGLTLGGTLLASFTVAAQNPSVPLPEAPQAPATAAQAPEQDGAAVTGLVQDVDHAAIPNAHLTLEHNGTHLSESGQTDATGTFRFTGVPPGEYTLVVKAPGFASWKIEDLHLLPGQTFALPEISLGVEALSATVDAITQEDLAEQQITEEEHQRILGVLPNFYVSYLPNAAPLTRKQKFKLAIRVSTDPVTFFTTGVTAAIAQAQGDFADYGPDSRAMHNVIRPSMATGWGPPSSARPCFRRCFIRIRGISIAVMAAWLAALFTLHLRS